MFVEKIDPDELRQGDIIQGLFYPEVNCSDIQLLGHPTKSLDNIQSPGEQSANLLAITEKKSKQGLISLTAQLKVNFGFFVLLSQCCDLAKREKGKPNISAFIASPLLEIPYPISRDEEKLMKLKANTKEAFTSLFYIPQNIPLEKDYMIDFNQVTSFPRSQYEFILSRKLLQMTNEFRVNFKLKLGSHFARPTQEEMEAKIYP